MYVFVTWLRVSKVDELMKKAEINYEVAMRMAETEKERKKKEEKTRKEQLRKDQKKQVEEEKSSLMLNDN